MPFPRPGTHPKPASSRAGTRRKPLLALAVLPLAGLCALPLYSARAQKASPSPATPPGTRYVTDPRRAPAGSGVVSSPVGGGTTPVSPAPPTSPVTPIVTPVPPPRVTAPTPTSALKYRYDPANSGVYNQAGQSASPGTILLPQTYSVTKSGTTTTYHAVGTADAVAASKAPLTFGKLFTRQLDGISYGQPLYYYGLALTNAFTGVKSTHNVVFVATNNNSVYAFDADSNTGTNGSALWRANFNSVANSIGPTSGNDITDIFGLPQADIQPLIGIVGTPVIDGVNNILYVVVRTTEGNGYAHRLHALDITTGLEKSFSPQLIGQQEDVFGDVSPVLVTGTGDDPFDDTHIFFDTTTENQRAALTLVNGSVYVAYGSFDNSPPYHGWMFSYNAANLQPQAVFCSTPNASTNTFDPTQPAATGGIDMSGVSPAYEATTATSGSMYFTTGLGVFDGNRGGADYGESVLKLSLNPSATTEYNSAVPPTIPYQRVPQALPQLAVTDYFTPYNYDSFLNAFDQDLGVGGISLLPTGSVPGHPHAMITAGIEGKVYLLDRDVLGEYNAFTDTGTGRAIAVFPAFSPDPTAASLLGSSYGVPAVYTDTTGTTTIYYHATGDVLRAFTISSGPPLSYLLPSSVTGNANFGFPGAMPIISHNAGAVGSSIIWELEGVATQQAGGGVANIAPIAVLHAYDANPANADPNTGAFRELFNSAGNGGGLNSIGDYVKFTMPLVANGKVYVAAGAPSSLTTGAASPGGVLTVFGPQPTAAVSTSEGYQYLITGPFQGFVGTNLTNYYSLTALDINSNPVAVTARNVHISLVDQTTNRVFSLGDVSFDGTSSYVIFTRAFSVPGSYNILARDGNGNTSQAGSILSVATPFFFVGDPNTNPSFDHYTLRVPPAAKDGALTTVSVTAVDARGIPIATTSTLTILDTVPNNVLAPYELQGGGMYPTAAGTGTYSVQFNGVGKHIVIVIDATGASTTAVVNVVSGGGGGGVIPGG